MNTINFKKIEYEFYIIFECIIFGSSNFAKMLIRKYFRCTLYTGSVFILASLLYFCAPKAETQSSIVSPKNIELSAPSLAVSADSMLVFMPGINNVPFPQRVPMGMPVVVETNKNVYSALKANRVKMGTPNINIPGQGFYQLPKLVEATGVSYISDMPAIVVAKDPNIRDHNPHNFSNLSKLQGLKHDQILCMIQDHAGNLWFGTFGGVSKYDGASFTNYTNKEGLPNNYIWSIFEDKDKNLWFGTEGGGVTKYDGITFTWFTTKEGLPDINVRAICQDQNGNIWFGTDGGACKYDGKSFTWFSTKEGLTDNKVKSILEDRNGNLWFGTNGGVSKFDGSKFTNFTKTEGLSVNEILSIAEDRDGNLWFGTDGGGAMMFDGEYLTIFTEKEGLSGNHIWSILQDNNGNMWFGSYGGGVSMYDGVNFSHFTENEGLPNNRVRAIMKDRTGKIWFGTYGGGVSKYNGESFTHFTDKEGLSNKKIWSILEDTKGRLWFGTDGGGVSRYNGKNFTHITKKEGLANNGVWAMHEDKNGNIWFGTYGGGVSKFDGKYFTQYTEKQGIPDNFIYSIYEDSKGILWFGSEKGVCKFDGKSFYRFPVSQGMPNCRILSILEDDAGNYWFGSYGCGVWRYDGKALTHFTTKEGLPNDFVFSILKDSIGDLWFGTNGGLCRYNGNGFIHITENEGLSNNFIFAMLFDKRGNLWAGTRFGLSKLSASNRQKMLELVDLSKETGNKVNPNISEDEIFFDTYGYDDGFLGVCVTGGNNGMNVYEATNGTIWIAANDRLTAYHQQGYVPDTIPPNVQLTSIELFGEKVEWVNLAQKRDTSYMLANGIRVGDFEFDSITPWYFLPKNLSLSHRNNNLTFNYIGISQHHPQKVRYRYMLEGMEESWSALTDKTFVSYGNLPHGNFTFKLKAMNSEGYWSPEYKYSFTIRTPWWLTWWFRTLYISFAALSLIGFYRWRMTTMRLRQKSLEEKVVKATQVIMKKNDELLHQSGELKILNENLHLQNEEITAQRDELELQRNTVALQKKQLEDIYNEVKDSINYAKLIQTSALPNLNPIRQILSDIFVLFRPKDAVSGDFYWYAETESHIVITVADCTGHGVPGALMSMLGMSMLKEIVRREAITQPDLILSALRKEVIKTLGQTIKIHLHCNGPVPTILVYLFSTGN